jgi:uncharacterized membrane protein (DUF485 family)
VDSPHARPHSELPITQQDPSIRHNARLGLALFFLYLAFYALFVYLVAFQLDLMKQTLAGVNYAIVYGMALIIAAIVLAVVYVMLCKTPTDESAG